jgi:hypothetical protein
MEIYIHTKDNLCFEEDDNFFNINLNSNFNIKLSNDCVVINGVKLQCYSSSRAKKRYKLITKLIYNGPANKKKEI